MIFLLKSTSIVDRPFGKMQTGDVCYFKVLFGKMHTGDVCYFKVRGFSPIVVNGRYLLERDERVLVAVAPGMIAQAQSKVIYSNNIGVTWVQKTGLCVGTKGEAYDLAEIYCQLLSDHLRANMSQACGYYESPVDVVDETEFQSSAILTGIREIADELKKKIQNEGSKVSALEKRMALLESSATPAAPVGDRQLIHQPVIGSSPGPSGHGKSVFTNRMTEPSPLTDGDTMSSIGARVDSYLEDEDDEDEKAQNCKELSRETKIGSGGDVADQRLQTHMFKIVNDMSSEERPDDTRVFDETSSKGKRVTNLPMPTQEFVKSAVYAYTQALADLKRGRTSGQMSDDSDESDEEEKKLKQQEKAARAKRKATKKGKTH